MADHELSDVRGHAVHDGVGDEQPAKIVGRKEQWGSAGVGQPGARVAWLADHPAAGQFVGSVWDTLTELQRSGHCPGVIDALRRVLTQHQPTPAGRCRTCRRVTWRRRRFPCIVWHQIRFDLLGLFAGAGRQPAGGPTAPSVNVITHQGDHR